jgi:hypothetical protein
MPQEMSDEELLNLGRLVVRIVDDKRLEGDHPAFRLLITLLVNNLRTQRTQLSARYLHRLTSIAVGHVGKVVERLEKLGYISVRRLGASSVARKLVNLHEENIPQRDLEEGSQEQQATVSFKEGEGVVNIDGHTYRVKMTIEDITYAGGLHTGALNTLSHVDIPSSF